MEKFLKLPISGIDQPKQISKVEEIITYKLISITGIIIVSQIRSNTTVIQYLGNSNPIIIIHDDIENYGFSNFIQDQMENILTTKWTDIIHMVTPPVAIHSISLDLGNDVIIRDPSLIAE